MTWARARAALAALVTLLALLSPAAPTGSGSPDLRLAAVDQCAPPSGRVAPRTTEQLPSVAPLPHATTPSGTVLTTPTGSAGPGTAPLLTATTCRDAASVRGPPGD